MRSSMIFAGRWVGVFLFVMAGLAFIDWCLTLVAFRGSPAIVGLILYGELYIRSFPPLPSGLVLLPCPGNGFGFLCGPWAIFLLFLFVLAVGVGLCINVKRRLAFGSAPRGVGLLDWRRLLLNLLIVASVLLAFGFVWGWLQYFGIAGRLPLVTPIYQVVAPFIHLLFIVTCFAAGRHLRWGGQTV